VHTAEVPSPKSHVTDTGVAVAVTDSPGTAAVADTDFHALELSHVHVGTPTNCGRPTAGLAAIAGFGSARLLRAFAANVAGSGAAAAGAGGFVSQTCVVCVVAMPLLLIASGHVMSYQAPFCPLWAASEDPGCGT
jgi:hypothetical protein